MINMIREDLENSLSAIWEDVPYFANEYCQSCEFGIPDGKAIECDAQTAAECPLLSKLVYEYFD